MLCFQNIPKYELNVTSLLLWMSAHMARVLTFIMIDDINLDSMKLKEAILLAALMALDP